MSETATAIVPRERQRTPIRMGERGLVLSTIDDAWRLATAIVASGFAAKGDTPESVLVKIQMGAEVGLSAMQAVQGIAVINSRPSLWGDAMLGLCMASPHWDVAAFSESVDGSGDARTATCVVARVGGAKCIRRFTVANAKAAGLWGKAGPWTNYPDRMLAMRARAFALRDTFPDVLRGIQSAEEQADVQPIERPATNAERLAAAISVEPIERQPVAVADPMPPPPAATAPAAAMFGIGDARAEPPD